MHCTLFGLPGIVGIVSQMVVCFGAVGTEDPDQERSFGEEDMARVQWSDVPLRAGPGARNVYCHQGCCEHLFVVKDVRRLHSDDPQFLAAYPVLLQKVRQS